MPPFPIPGFRISGAGFFVDYSGASGAEGLFIVADSSQNGRFWRLNTAGMHDIMTGDNQFTIQSPTGERMVVTVVHPQSVTFRTGTFLRDGAMDNGDKFPFGDEIFTHNKWIDFQSQDGEFLVVMTVLEEHQPIPSITAPGTGLFRTLQVGGQTITIAPDSIQAANWTEPFVAIASPTGGSRVPSQRPLAVDLQLDAGGREVTHVELRINGAVVGQDNSAPWNLVWNNPVTGRHVATARVQFADGTHLESHPVLIHVVQPRDAFAVTPAVTYDATNGPRPVPGGVGYINRNGRVDYYMVDFGPGNGANLLRLQFNVLNGGHVDVFLNSRDNPALGRIQLSGSSNTFELEIPPVSGMHDVIFLFNGSTGVGTFASFQFDSIEPRPEALFEVNPSTGFAPLTVSFNATASTAPLGTTLVSYAWDFGDGNFATGAQVQHIYQQGGNYFPRLTVTASNGSAHQAVTQIFVDEPRYAQSVAILPEFPIISPGTTLAFSAVLLDQFGEWMQPQPSGFDWSVDAGGQVGSNGLFTSNGERGEFLVSAYAAGVLGTTVITVGNLPPTAVIAANRIAGVPPFTVVFDGTQSSDPDGTVVAWEWTVGPGQVLFGPQPVYSFREVGEHTVVLTVYDDEGASASTELTILVEEPDPRVFVEDNGLVVIEGEHFRELRRNGDSIEWSVQSSTAGFAGSGYVALPEISGNVNWPAGAEVVYAVQITNPGTYYVSIRRIAPQEVTIHCTWA
ncbi:MAG: PKD domain-containing protein [Verrucomicrobia bacterium]|nr:PKD domain-containing protein [Verrucomicrobiota bacterium]